MPELIVTKTGSQLMGGLCIDFYSNLKLGLFKNDVPETIEVTWDDVEECDFPGYASSHGPDGRVQPTGWIGPTEVTPDQVWVATPISWTSEAGAEGHTIWGYFVIDDDSNLIIFQKRSAAFVISSVGENYIVLPKFSFGSLVPR